MPRKTKRRCWVCAEPATITIETRERPRLTWLCTNPVCQDRYYRLLAKESK